MKTSKSIFSNWLRVTISVACTNFGGIEPAKADYLADSARGVKVGAEVQKLEKNIKRYEKHLIRKAFCYQILNLKNKDIGKAERDQYNKFLFSDIFQYWLLIKESSGEKDVAIEAMVRSALKSEIIDQKILPEKISENEFRQILGVSVLTVSAKDVEHVYKKFKRFLLDLQSNKDMSEIPLHEPLNDGKLGSGSES